MEKSTQAQDTHFSRRVGMRLFSGVQKSLKQLNCDEQQAGKLVVKSSVKPLNSSCYFERWSW